MAVLFINVHLTNKQEITDYRLTDFNKLLTLHILPVVEKKSKYLIVHLITENPPRLIINKQFEFLQFISYNI